jgi:hypothetical protein
VRLYFSASANIHSFVCLVSREIDVNFNDFLLLCVDEAWDVLGMQASYFANDVYVSTHVALCHLKEEKKCFKIKSEFILSSAVSLGVLFNGFLSFINTFSLPTPLHKILSTPSLLLFFPIVQQFIIMKMSVY